LWRASPPAFWRIEDLPLVWGLWNEGCSYETALFYSIQRVGRWGAGIDPDEIKKKEAPVK